MTDVRMLKTAAQRTLTWVAAAAALIAPLAAQEPTPKAPTTQELLNRIDAQDQRIEDLTSQYRSANAPAAKQGSSGLSVVYKKGFLLKSTDPNSPFELRINGRLQARFTGFDADDGDPTGTGTSAVNDDRSDFEIERGRLVLRGTFFDKNTHFYLNIDADTDDNHQAVFHDFWVNYDVAKNHSVYVGKAFFPGSRDWISGSARTHLADRSVATTFFRPGRTIGVWMIGKVLGDLNYRVMVGNGLRTSNFKPAEVDTNFAYAASFWLDPFAAYGKGYADLKHHEDLAMRLGVTASYTKQDEGQNAATREANGIRLSNSMKLGDMGVEDYEFQMAAADAAIKFQGFSANCEMFYRWLDQINTAGMPAARRSYYDWGGYCDAGFMIIPGRLEPVLRVSSVQGTERDSWEYAAGVNYYVDGTHTNKLTFDVTKVDGIPTKNAGPNYRVGDDGWMFRLQWQIAF